MNYNRIILGGRITANPELKTSLSGTEVCRFTVAVDGRGKESDTTFAPCVAFGRAAEFVSGYFQKGNNILVEGRLQQDNYTDRDGNKRTTFSVIIDRAEFVDKKDAAAAPAAKPITNAGNEFAQDYGADGTVPLANDADLPF